MQVRDIDAKVAAINLEDAKKIGLTSNVENLSASINGSIVDIEFIDEFSNDWRLPKIYLKAQAYLTTLKQPNLKRYVKLISNKVENFKRISDLTNIEELAYSKVAKFCDENNFGIDESLNEVIYGNIEIIESANIHELVENLNKKIEEYNNNINEYQNIIDKLDSNDENYEQLASDTLANCKISIISIYRDFLVVEQAIANSPYQEFNHNAYDNKCPFCHKAVDFIDKDKLIYVNGNKVYYRRPGVDPADYTDDDIIYILSDEQVAEMFGEDAKLHEEELAKNDDSYVSEEYIEEVPAKNKEEIFVEEKAEFIPVDSPYIAEEDEEQVDIPDYNEYNNVDEVETEEESLLESNNDGNDYSNYNVDSEYNNIKEPTTEFEKLLFYSNDNTPIVVNFVSSQQENIIKKSTIVEWVGNEVRSETIRLTDVDNSVISDTLKINDAIDSSKQYTHGFEFENITKHFVEGLEDDNGNTRVIINDKHGNTISLTELFDNEKEDKKTSKK